MKKVIYTDKAPKPIGPYSQAVLAGDTLYASGQLGLDPATMKLKGETVEEQAAQAFRNVTAILEAAGFRLEDVVKVTVLLADMHDFPALNKVYAGYFKENYPARVTFAAALPMNARVEIEVVAFASKLA